MGRRDGSTLIDLASCGGQRAPPPPTPHRSFPGVLRHHHRRPLPHPARSRTPSRWSPNAEPARYSSMTWAQHTDRDAIVDHPVRRAPTNVSSRSGRLKSPTPGGWRYSWAGARGREWSGGGSACRIWLGSNDGSRSARGGVVGPGPVRRTTCLLYTYDDADEE